MSSLSITEIITSTSTIPLILTLRNPANRLVEKFVEIAELLEIIQRHQDCKDPLSTKLRNWAVIALPENEEEVLTQNFKDKAIDNIQKLFREILIDPLDGSRLEDPMIDRDDWVWEKWKMQEWLKYFLISPYDKKPIDAKPHLFAKEILAWAKNCCEMMDVSISFETTLQVTDLRHLNRYVITQSSEQNAFIDTQKISTYLTLAKNAKEKRECEKVIALLQQKNEMLTKARDEDRAVTNRAIEQAKMVAEAGLKEVRNRIDQSQQSQQRTVETLMTRLEIDRQRIEASENRTAQLEQRTAQQDIEIGALRSGYGQKEVTIHYITREVQQQKKKKCVIQ